MGFYSKWKVKQNVGLHTNKYDFILWYHFKNTFTHCIKFCCSFCYKSWTSFYFLSDWSFHNNSLKKAWWRQMKACFIRNISRWSQFLIRSMVHFSSAAGICTCVQDVQFAEWMNMILLWSDLHCSWSWDSASLSLLLCLNEVLTYACQKQMFFHFAVSMSSFCTEPQRSRFENPW